MRIHRENSSAYTDHSPFSCPKRPCTRTLKRINSNSIMHSHSLDRLLFKVSQCTRKTSSITFGIRLLLLVIYYLGQSTFIELHKVGNVCIFVFITFENKVDIIVSHINVNSKNHGKCKFHEKFILLVRRSIWSPQECISVGCVLHASVAVSGVYTPTVHPHLHPCPQTHTPTRCMSGYAPPLPRCMLGYTLLWTDKHV